MPPNVTRDGRISRLKEGEVMSDIEFIDRISHDRSSAQLEAHMPSGQWVIMTYTNGDQYKQALEMMTQLFSFETISKIESLLPNAMHFKESPQ
jgi:hypothetical protein